MRVKTAGYFGTGLNTVFQVKYCDSTQCGLLQRVNAAGYCSRLLLQVTVWVTAAGCCVRLLCGILHRLTFVICYFGHCRGLPVQSNVRTIAATYCCRILFGLLQRVTVPVNCTATGYWNRFLFKYDATCYFGSLFTGLMWQLSIGITAAEYCSCLIFGPLQLVTVAG